MTAQENLSLKYQRMVLVEKEARGLIYSDW